MNNENVANKQIESEKIEEKRAAAIKTGSENTRCHKNDNFTIPQSIKTIIINNNNYREIKINSVHVDLYLISQ